MKKLIALLLAALLLTASTAGAAFAADRTQIAGELNVLGLLQGTNADGGFSLEREPTRAEALTMLIRLLGVEKDALEGTWESPFTDVPDWAKPYAGYAYENGIAKGTTETTFGASGVCSAQMYTTYVLRALGYSDAVGGDFEYDSAVEFAQSAGLISRLSAKAGIFTRAEMAEVSYNALFSHKRGSTTYLIQNLQLDGAIDSYLADALMSGFLEKYGFMSAMENRLKNSSEVPIKLSGSINTTLNYNTEFSSGTIAIIYDSALQGVANIVNTSNGLNELLNAYIDSNYIYLDTPPISGISEVPMKVKLDLPKLLALIPADSKLLPSDLGAISLMKNVVLTETGYETVYNISMHSSDLLEYISPSLVEQYSNLSVNLRITVDAVFTVDSLIERVTKLGLSHKYIDVGGNVVYTQIELNAAPDLSITFPDEISGYGAMTDMLIPPAN
ncbi:MAG: hypothetical protein LBC38_00820 [Oscillospiraceae bacterium]|jgi:hypothetical protein|nr:hypothetical protein [Oscillospiraceae bacterium]